MTWIFIGTVVGLLLGLTGAGGAIIAVPLFVHLLKVSTHEATALSLVTVALGSAFNWPQQFKNTAYTSALMLFAFSIAGTYFTSPLKPTFSEGTIILLFSVVAFIGGLLLWKRRGGARTEPKHSIFNVQHLLATGLGGFALGAIVTITGLGGGVLLVPFLTGILGLSLSTAAATSLFTVFLTSVASLIFQWQQVGEWLSMENLLGLAAGSCVSVFFVRIVLRRVKVQKLDLIRKILVTAVITASIISLI